MSQRMEWIGSSILGQIAFAMVWASRGWLLVIKPEDVQICAPAAVQACGGRAGGKVE